MTEDTFWCLIDSSRKSWDRNQADGNMDRQAALLQALLEKLTPEEIVTFREIYREHLVKAYRWGYDLLSGHAAFLLSSRACSNADTSFSARSS